MPAPSSSSSSIEAQLGRKTIYNKAGLLATPSGFDEDAGFDSSEAGSRGYDSTVDLRRLMLCISIGSYHRDVRLLEGQDEVGKLKWRWIGS